MLLALLDGLGIEGDPVLVSTQLGDGMDMRLPNASLFNHVIVRAVIAGKVYWLDGTRLGDRHVTELDVPEDAVTAFQSGVAVREGGGVNVSQLFNLAALQLHFGRYEEARRNIDAFDAASDAASTYGLMVYHLDHGCAHFLTGDHAGAEADVDYERAHERDGPRLLTELLLCTGDTREAAAVMVRRLDDPEQRVDALLELSDFDARTHPVTTDPTDAGLTKLKGQPDVIAAIGRAGGTRRFRIQPVDT